MTHKQASEVAKTGGEPDAKLSKLSNPEGSMQKSPLLCPLGTYIRRISRRATICVKLKIGNLPMEGSFKSSNRLQDRHLRDRISICGDFQADIFKIAA